MRTPKTLSYSSLALFEKDPDEFYIRYLAEQRAPRLPQEPPMNARILKRLSGQHDNNVLCPANVGPALASWLMAWGWDTKKCLTPAGKNFASMDLQFLRKLPDFTKHVKLAHRCIDPAVLYWRPGEDEQLPGTQKCMERAGIGGKVAHDAVADAEVVVKLIRRAIFRPDGMSRPYA